MQRQTSRTVQNTTRRGGAVIVVVLTLLTSLMFLGIFFYSLSDAELNVSRTFLESPDQVIDPDPLWDVGLEQIIVGTRPEFDRSALASNMQSILATMLGRPNTDVVFDPQLRINGGITVLPNDPDFDGFANDRFYGIDYDGDGTIDYAGDGAIDGSGRDLILNFSPVAQALTGMNPQLDAFSQGTLPAPRFSPATDYTYPDANSIFLAYDAFTVDPVTRQRYHVVIPSFCRPQYQSDRRFARNFDDVYEVDSTVRQVLRPHSLHVNADGTQRFLSAPAGTTAQSGDRNRIIAPFPTRIDVDQNLVSNEAGIFSWDGVGPIPAYEYDVDNDGDGVMDSVWLDLGHSLIDLADGRQVVPMYAAKIVDLDALLNVNAHGNLNGVFYLNRKLVEDDPGMPSPPAWSVLSFGESNQGMSPGEVNLAMGLIADPTRQAFIEQNPGLITTIMSPHFGTFGLGEIPPQIATSNMELLMLLAGRAQFDSSANPLLSAPPLPGRWGDDSSIFGFSGVLASSMYNNDPAQTVSPPFPDGAPHPAPGVPGLDDDGDSNLYANTTPPPASRFGHPLDTLGVGDFTLEPGANRGAQRVLITPTALGSNPVQFPAYSDFWMRSRQDQNDNPLFGAELQPNSRTSNHDEPDETILEPAFRRTDDNVFDSSETFALHATDSDRRAAGIASRLTELAPFNFRDNLLAGEIRKQFTTDSWDRLESSFSRSPGRPWEFNDWSFTLTANGVTESFELAFPPKFRDANVFDDIDPFRDPVRSMLARNLFSSMGSLSFGDRRNMGATNERLDINRILHRLEANGQPEYRSLTDHPADPGAAAIVWLDPTSASYPPTTPQEQEFWARYDRQRMARDIYVLLYTLGGGQDSVDYTNIPNAVTGPDTVNDPTGSLGLQLRELYDDVQLIEMAQFAVNMVDALDPDDVITRFEFDVDLSNGWNLDDNPFDSDATLDRAVVFGVEAQQLTISEGLFVFAQRENSDVDATQWNDAIEQSFAFIELRNSSTQEINLSTGHWGVGLEVNNAGASLLRRQVVIKKFGNVAPGGLYSIGSAGDTTIINPADGTTPYSELHVDPLAGTAFQRIAPVAVPLSLDLISDDDSGLEFDLVDPDDPTATALPKGDFFSKAIAMNVTPGQTIEVILRRRLHPTRTAPVLMNAADQADNPLIEVDRMVIEAGLDGGFAIFDLPVDTPSATEVQNELHKLLSQERPQPLHRDAEDNYMGDVDDPVTVPGASWSGSTLGNTNHLTLTQLPNQKFTLWQPHHDRDFTSVIELLSIPLYGPSETTSRIGVGGVASPRMSGFYTTPAATLRPTVAAGRFLYPQDATNIGNALDPMDPMYSTTTKANNRWYRLFEAIQVDSQALRAMEPSLAVRRRVPGRINLNTLRHEPVLAGLIDDPQIRGLPADFTAIYSTDDLYGSVFADDLGVVGVRNWFDQLLVARDGIDPILNTGGALVPIPGIPGSKPFRASSYVDPTAYSTEPTVHTEYDYSLSHTLLRGHLSQATVRMDPTGNPGFPGLQLFAARSNDDVSWDPTAENVVDYYTRNRLLAKIANNTTNRSHVFAVWLTVAYFEAHQPGAHVQIGGPANDLPERKLFCIVDMSRLEEAYLNDASAGQPGRFDFRKFIIYRKRIK